MSETDPVIGSVATDSPAPAKKTRRKKTAKKKTAVKKTAARKKRAATAAPKRKKKS